jgi:methionyl-tRNA formyltransferase
MELQRNLKVSEDIRALDEKLSDTAPDAIKKMVKNINKQESENNVAMETKSEILKNEGLKKEDEKEKEKESDSALAPHIDFLETQIKNQDSLKQDIENSIGIVEPKNTGIKSVRQRRKRMPEINGDMNGV